MNKTQLANTPAQLFWNRFRRNRLAVAGACVVGFLFIVAALAPWLAPYDPNAIDPYNILEAPTLKHWLGTDDLGRDVMSRMIFGARISLEVGLVSVSIATSIGILLGSLAGFYRGWLDTAIMRLVDIMLSFPTIFLIISAIAFLEPNIGTIMAVIGATSWMGIARLVRAEFLSLREREFVLAARAQGGSDFRIIFHHILPNSLVPVMVTATLGIAGAILTESSLSFLGIGVQPPTPSWGNILTAGKDNIDIAWWLSMFPGMAILITVLGYNLLGEGLRDSLDPRLRGRT